MKELQKCLEYCREQNGMDECKNCGLNSDMIHGAEQDMLKRVVGEIEGLMKLSKTEWTALTNLLSSLSPKSSEEEGEVN